MHLTNDFAYRNLWGHWNYIDLSLLWKAHSPNMYQICINSMVRGRLFTFDVLHIDQIDIIKPHLHICDLRGDAIAGKISNFMRSLTIFSSIKCRLHIRDVQLPLRRYYFQCNLRSQTNPQSNQAIAVNGSKPIQVHSRFNYC